MSRFYWQTPSFPRSRFNLPITEIRAKVPEAPKQRGSL